MKRAIPYVWLCVKDGLGAISVMVVYIQNGDPCAVFTQYLCSNSRVIQIAVAAKKVRAPVDGIKRFSRSQNPRPAIAQWAEATDAFQVCSSIGTPVFVG